MTLHPIPPVWDGQAETLILGSFPSVRSRESGFFYGHPQNRFWRVLAGVFSDAVPASTAEKTDFLHRHRIALWDVIASCEITGSSDSSIKNVIPNDISALLSHTPITRIFVNGKTAEKYYRKYIRPSVGTDAILLPSTSPANAAWSLGQLIEEWKTAILI